ncbi:MAG: HWE histidine kinase domain-containing protein [Beijerinckiaceae bacterium]|nr:HWE histidine kinase domain-containing protein [Beijerinckiaceae bacterium]
MASHATTTDAHEEIVLILASLGRDANVARAVLAQSNIASRICLDIEELTSNLRFASAAIISVEDLSGHHMDGFFHWVRTQPEWSDFPFIVLTFQNASSDQRMLSQLGNVAIIERPFHAGTFTLATEGALRARRRQKASEALIQQLEAVSGRQKVLIRELHHRVRNMLATIQGVMAVTSRSSGTIQEFTQSFSERLQSLARTHQLLTDDLLQSASLAHLLKQELTPFDDGSGQRFQLQGPPVDLPSSLAVPFGMAIHELTTNALKYGALSTPVGRIAVDWSVDGKDTARELTLRWTERGGPVVRPPKRRGFGTILIDRVLGPQAHARTSLTYEPTGIVFEMQAPLPSPEINEGAFP